MDTTTYVQYADFIKPEWAPPAWLFGPVWTFLYIVIAVTFGYVAYKFWKGEVDRSVALPFMLNIGFNVIYTYFQFTLRNFFLASVDILLVLGTLVWAMAAVWKKYRWIAVTNIPYLAWVSFATVLQLTITYLNR